MIDWIIAALIVSVVANAAGLIILHRRVTWLERPRMRYPKTTDDFFGGNGK